MSPVTGLRVRALPLIAAIAATGAAILAQHPPAAIPAPEKARAVNVLCERIEKFYAFAEGIQAVCTRLRAGLRHGRYPESLSGQEFARRVNEDLESVTHDKHFHIAYDPAQAAAMAEPGAGGGSFYTPQIIQRYRRLNYGILEVKVMAGNVGFLDLRDFFPLKWSAQRIVAAMDLLADCDALIIDLRGNGGGEDQTVTFLLSYFLPPGDSPVVFSTSHTRSDNSYYQSAAWPWVPGKALDSTPLYLLTSRSTFSGAEAFAFRLQALQRAVVVGERTRGGANPVEIQEILGAYVLFIPSSRTVSSLTGGDWEGIGVRPDIEAPADKALAWAHEEALKRLAAGDAGQRAYREWTLAGVRARNNPQRVPASLLREYAGSYGERAVHFIDGELFFQRGDRARLRMIAISQDTFMIDTLDHLRLRFARGGDGAWRLESLSDDGGMTVYPRTR
jgi:hypothetical protein